MKLGQNFPFLRGFDDKVYKECMDRLKCETGKIRRSYASFIGKLHAHILKTESGDEQIDRLKRNFHSALNFFEYDSIRSVSYKYGHKERFKKYRLNFQKYCNKCVCELPSETMEKVYGIVVDEALQEKLDTDEAFRKLEQIMNKVLGRTSLPLISFDDNGVCSLLSDASVHSDILSRICK